MYMRYDTAPEQSWLTGPSSPQIVEECCMTVEDRTERYDELSGIERDALTGLDPYGFDPEMYEKNKGFFEFLYRYYWRVSVRGLENIPDTGAALLVSNHSGVFPWDGAMITMAIHEEHESHRFVRNLF